MFSSCFRAFKLILGLLDKENEATIILKNLRNCCPKDIVLYPTKLMPFAAVANASLRKINSFVQNNDYRIDYSVLISCILPSINRK
jgi:hypothetical protein